MFPKEGNNLPGRGDGAPPLPGYASAIAEALRADVGDTHRATKTVMRWTGASEKSVKNWFGGQIGPKGLYLLSLLHQSNIVLHAVLHAAGRDDVLGVLGVEMAYDKESRPAKTRGKGQRFRSQWLEQNVPDHDPDDGSEAPPPAALSDLVPHVRQHWFLEQLLSGRGVRTTDIVRHWGVTEKTAKRDISALKVRGLIEFVGSSRAGGYRVRKR